MRERIPSSPAPGGEFLFYQMEDGRTRLQVRLEGETVWLTQTLLAELLQKDVRTINEHIQNIFEERELEADSVIRKFRITAADGKSYDTQHYNLVLIISVGYRVKSHRGTQFRIWAIPAGQEHILEQEDGKKHGVQVVTELSRAFALGTAAFCAWGYLAGFGRLSTSSLTDPAIAIT